MASSDADRDLADMEEALLRLLLDSHSVTSSSAVSCELGAWRAVQDDGALLGSIRAHPITSDRRYVLTFHSPTYHVPDDGAVLVNDAMRAISLGMTYSVELRATLALLDTHAAGTALVHERHGVVLGRAPLLAGLRVTPDGRIEPRNSGHGFLGELAHTNLDFAFIVRGGIYIIPSGLQPIPNAVSVRVDASHVRVAVKSCGMPAITHAGAFELRATHSLSGTTRVLGPIEFHIPRFVDETVAASAASPPSVLLLLNALGVQNAAQAFRLFVFNAPHVDMIAALHPTFAAYTWTSQSEAVARLAVLMTGSRKNVDGTLRTLEQELLAGDGRGSMFDDVHVVHIGYMANRLLWEFLVPRSQVGRIGACKYGRLYGTGQRHLQQNHTIVTETVHDFYDRVAKRIATTAVASEADIVAAVSAVEFPHQKFTDEAEAMIVRSKFRRINGMPVDAASACGFELPINDPAGAAAAAKHRRLLQQQRRGGGGGEAATVQQQQQQQQPNPAPVFKVHLTSHKIDSNTIAAQNGTNAQTIGFIGKVRKCTFLRNPDPTQRTKMPGNSGKLCEAETCVNKRVGLDNAYAITCRCTGILPVSVDAHAMLLVRELLSQQQHAVPVQWTKLPAEFALVFFNHTPLLFLLPTLTPVGSVPAALMRARDILILARRAGRFQTRSISFWIEFPSPIDTAALLRNSGCGVVPALFIETDTGRAERPLIIVRGRDGRVPLLDTLMLRREDKALVHRETGRVVCSVNELYELQLADLVAAAEEEQFHVAMSVADIVPGRTHYLEFTPQAWYGLMTLLCALGDYGPSTRLMYYAHHMTQAANSIGWRREANRTDARAGVMSLYAQRRLAPTMVEALTGLCKLPFSNIVRVTVNTCGGEGEEDAIVGNAASSDRGLARTEATYIFSELVDTRSMPRGASFGPRVYRYRVRLPNPTPVGTVVRWTRELASTVLSEDAEAAASATAPAIGAFVTVEADNNNGVYTVRHEAAAVRRRQMESYAHLHPWTGLPRIGSVLRSTDPLIALVGEDGTDASVFATKVIFDSGRVERVTVAPAPSGRVRVTIHVVMQMDNGGGGAAECDCVGIPMGVGDKFTAAQGNKGVIGRLVPASELPHCGDIVPDIVINPATVVGRTIAGVMLAMAAGILVACTGEQIDATPFARVKAHERIAAADCAFRNMDMLCRRVTRLVCRDVDDDEVYAAVLADVVARRATTTAEEARRAMEIVDEIAVHGRRPADPRFHMAFTMYSTRIASCTQPFVCGRTGRFLGPLKWGLIDMYNLRRFAATELRACGNDTTKDRETKAPTGHGVQRFGRQEVAALRGTGATNVCQDVIHNTSDMVSRMVCPSCGTTVVEAIDNDAGGMRRHRVRCVLCKRGLGPECEVPLSNSAVRMGQHFFAANVDWRFITGKTEQ